MAIILTQCPQVGLSGANLLSFMVPVDKKCTATPLGLDSAISRVAAQVLHFNKFLLA